MHVVSDVCRILWISDAAMLIRCPTYYMYKCAIDTKIFNETPLIEVLTPATSFTNMQL